MQLRSLVRVVTMVKRVGKEVSLDAVADVAKRAKTEISAVTDWSCRNKVAQRIVYWNVNGLRALAKKKGVLDAFVGDYSPDIICLGEVKCTAKDNPLDLRKIGYKCILNSATIKKGGYSGTAVYTKVEPISVTNGIGVCDDEGRVITIELPDYFLVTVYVPNSGQKLDRLQFRTETWDKAFVGHIKKLGESKAVIVAGDMNVAHLDIDIHDPISNKNKTAGFCDSERSGFSEMLNVCDLVDSYRHLHPEETVKGYTYYSYRFGARAKQKGWRIDHFLLSRGLVPRICKVDVLHDQIGSDHLPLMLDLLVKPCE